MYSAPKCPAALSLPVIDAEAAPALAVIVVWALIVALMDIIALEVWEERLVTCADPLTPVPVTRVTGG